VTLSQPDVARYIQENFVPCWESVRPVPKVTIDFGDGKVLERTLQGNTVMYVCLPDGRPVDAYPGIYTGQALRKGLEETLQLVRGLGPLERYGEPAEAEIRAWHRARVSRSVENEIRRITLSKAFVESPLLDALGIGRKAAFALRPGGPPAGGPSGPETAPADGRAATQEAAPDPLADPEAALARLSEKIEDVSKQPATVEQLRARYAKLPEEKRPSPEKLGAMAVQLDSDTNLRSVRPAVHLLFAGFETLPDAGACSSAVYRKILRVPLDDPYLGLADALVPGTPDGRSGRE
jgi:hypothetical protein